MRANAGSLLVGQRQRLARARADGERARADAGRSRRSTATRPRAGEPSQRRVAAIERRSPPRAVGERAQEPQLQRSVSDASRVAVLAVGPRRAHAGGELRDEPRAWTGPLEPARREHQRRAQRAGVEQYSRAIQSGERTSSRGHVQRERPVAARAAAPAGPRCRSRRATTTPISSWRPNGTISTEPTPTLPAEILASGGSRTARAGRASVVSGSTWAMAAVTREF